MTESSLSVSVKADVTQLTASMAVAQADVRETGAELRKAAQAMKDAGDAASSELRAGLDSAAAAAIKARAELASLQAELREIKSTGHEPFAQIRESLEGLTSPLLAVRNNLGEISELFLAGFGVERLWDGIKEAAETGEGLERLHQMTGMSVQDLAALRVAATETGSDFESFGRLLPKFAETMQEAAISPTTKQAETFKAMGISATDAEGHLRPMTQVLEEVSRKLSGYEEGTGRAALESNLFGTRLGGEMLPLLVRVGEQGFGVLREKSAALSQQWTGEDVEAANALTESIGDMKLAWQGLLAEVGKLGVFDAASRTLRSLAADIHYLFGADDEAKAAGLAIQIDHLKEKLAGDIKIGTWDSFIKQDQDRLDKLTAQYDTLIDKIRASRTDKPEADKPKENPPSIEKTETGSAMEAAHAELTGLLRDKKAYGDAALALEHNFWTQQLAAAKEGSAQYGQIVSQLRQVEVEQNGKATESGRRASEELKRAAEQSNQAGLRALEQTTVQTEKGSIQRIAALERERDYAIRVWGQYSSEATAAIKAVKAAQDEANAFQKSALASWTQNFDEGMREQIDAATGNYDQQIALAREWAAEMATIYGGDVSKYRAALNTKDSLIKQQTEDEKRKYEEVADRFASGLGQMLSGHQKFSAVARGWVEELAQHEISTILKTVAASIVGDQAKAASHDSAVAQGKAVDAAVGSTTVLGDAYRAAAGAYAAISGIPFVGPVLAPAAAAVAFAAVSAFDVFSAEGGFEQVPSGGALTMLHPQEMVLPARYASVMRDIQHSTTNDNRETSSGHTINNTVNMHGVRADNVEEMLGRVSRSTARNIARKVGRR